MTCLPLSHIFVSCFSRSLQICLQIQKGGYGTLTPGPLLVVQLSTYRGMVQRNHINGASIFMVADAVAVGLMLTLQYMYVIVCACCSE